MSSSWLLKVLFLPRVADRSVSGTAEWNKHVFCFSTVRNKDMSWPEEMSFIANSSKMDRHKGKFKERTVQPLTCSDRRL